MRDEYEPLPEGYVICDWCHGDGFIEWGDDCISEKVDCSACYGEGLITEARHEKRQEGYRELKAVWSKYQPEEGSENV